MTILLQNYYSHVIIKDWIVISIFLWKTDVFHKNSHMSEDVLWINVDNPEIIPEIPALKRKNALWKTVDKYGDNWGKPVGNVWKTPVIFCNICKVMMKIVKVYPTRSAFALMFSPPRAYLSP